MSDDRGAEMGKLLSKDTAPGADPDKTDVGELFQVRFPGGVMVIEGRGVTNLPV